MTFQNIYSQISCSRFRQFFLVAVLFMLSSELLAQEIDSQVIAEDKFVSKQLYLKSLTLDTPGDGNESARFNHLWMAGLMDASQPSIRYNLALGFAAIGMQSEAFSMMQSAFDLSGRQDKEIGEALTEMAYRTNHLNVAEETLKALTEAYPDDKSSFIRLVEVYRRKGEPSAAIEILDRLIEMGQGKHLLIFEKAKILAEMGKIDETRRLLEEQVASMPTDLESVSYLAYLYLSQEEVAKAKGLIKATRRYIADAPILDELSVYIHIADNDYVRAAKEIQKMAHTEDAQPADIEKLMSQSMSASQDKVAMTKALIPVQEDLIEVYEQSDGIKLSLANNYFVVGDSIKGETLLSKMIDAKTEETFPYTYFIEKYIQAHQTEKVIELSEVAMGVFPDKGTYYVFALMGYGESKDKVGSEIVLDKAIKMVPKTDPDYGDIMLIKADAESEAGRYDLARNYYEEAIQYAKTPLAHNNYAYFLAVHGTKEDLDKAEELASKAVQRVRNFPTFLDTYAWVLYLKGEYALAKVYIDSAISNEEVPNHVYYEHQGEILFKLGKIEEAITAFEKAIRFGGKAEVLNDRIKQIKSKNAQ